MLTRCICSAIGGVLLGLVINSTGLNPFSEPLFPTQNPAVYQKMVELCGESEFKEITLSESLDDRYRIEVKCVNGIKASAEIIR